MLRHSAHHSSKSRSALPSNFCYLQRGALGPGLEEPKPAENHPIAHEYEAKPWLSWRTKVAIESAKIR